MFSSARLFVALLLVSSSLALTLPVLDLKPTIGLAGGKRSVVIPGVLDLKPAVGILGSKRSVAIPFKQQDNATPANTDNISVHPTAGSGPVTLSHTSDDIHQRPNLPLITTSQSTNIRYRHKRLAIIPNLPLHILPSSFAPKVLGHKRSAITPNRPNLPLTTMQSTQKDLGQQRSVASLQPISIYPAPTSQASQ